jgi:hypothetical protein
MNKHYILTTEGDCEGRTTRTLGHFYGTPEKIIAYALENNLKEYYKYGLKEVDTIDVSNHKTNGIVAEIGHYGVVSYKTDEDFKKELKRKSALNKLTPEERNLLGL